MSTTRIPATKPESLDGSERAMDEEYTDLGPYVLAVVEGWRTIAMVAVAVGGLTALVAGLLVPKWYRASAIIRPVSMPTIQSQMVGISGEGLANRLSAWAFYFGASETSSNANEYMTMLRSFAFNVYLARSHNLVGRMLGVGPSHGGKESDWAVYRAMRNRFYCKYSFSTENIELWFEARDRREAEAVLGYYIDHLRGLLRAREIGHANVAIASLEGEAALTPDPLLRVRLYELVARQIVRRDTAQVEADFSFQVLDSPAAPDKPYRPRVLFDSLLAAVLAMLVMAAVVVVRFQNGHAPRRSDGRC